MEHFIWEIYTDTESVRSRSIISFLLVQRFLFSVDLNSGSIKIGSFRFDFLELKENVFFLQGSVDGDVSLQCEKGDVDAFFSSTGSSTIRAQTGLSTEYLLLLFC